MYYTALTKATNEYASRPQFPFAGLGDLRAMSLGGTRN